MNENAENQTVTPEAQNAENQAADPQSADAPKKKGRGRRKGSGAPPRIRNPRPKDWLRVINSQGNGLPNVTISLQINEANGVVRLITNAPKQEGSDELEGERVQIFRITSYDVINNPNDNPILEAEAEKKAEEEARAKAKIANSDEDATEDQPSEEPVVGSTPFD